MKHTLFAILFSTVLSFAQENGFERPGNVLNSYTVGKGNFVLQSHFEYQISHYTSEGMIDRTTYFKDYINELRYGLTDRIELRGGIMLTDQRRQPWIDFSLGTKIKLMTQNQYKPGISLMGNFLISDIRFIGVQLIMDQKISDRMNLSASFGMRRDFYSEIWNGGARLTRSFTDDFSIYGEYFATYGLLGAAFNHQFSGGMM